MTALLTTYDEKTLERTLDLLVGAIDLTPAPAELVPLLTRLLPAEFAPAADETDPQTLRLAAGRAISALPYARNLVSLSICLSDDGVERRSVSINLAQWSIYPLPSPLFPKTDVGNGFEQHSRPIRPLYRKALWRKLAFVTWLARELPTDLAAHTVETTANESSARYFAGYAAEKAARGGNRS